MTLNNQVRIQMKMMSLKLMTIVKKEKFVKIKKMNNYLLIYVLLRESV